MQNNNSRALVVDLDGTLVNTNTLFESILLFTKKHPTRLLKLVSWLFRGVAHFKDKLSIEVLPNAEIFPYNKSVVNYVEHEQKAGLEIYLVTETNIRIGKAVAKSIGEFTSVIGSDDRQNLKGKIKLDAIEEAVGNQKFDYLGNSRSDLLVWKKAKKVIICSNNTRLKNKIKKEKDRANIEILECNSSKNLKFWIKQLRIYQWSKNILLFLALFMSHRILEIDLIAKSIIAFFSFSFVASSVYLLNDLFDLETDRQHPTKRKRPFASGKISIVRGLFAVPLLITVSFLLSVNYLPGLHTSILFIYLITTTGYSLYFKEILFIDVILLGALYTLRILAGGFATGIEVSSWLLGFSGFFFLSLAFMKRYTDLKLFEDNSKEELLGRAYTTGDIDFVQKVGIASGFVSLLILVLYITSEQVLLLYGQPTLLWLAIPVILYWLMNMWYNTHKGLMTEDPIIFAVKDKTSYIVFILVLVIIITATIL